MKAPSANALLDVLARFGKAAARKPAGEGWFTLQELADQANLSPPAMKYRMDMAKKRGVQVELAPGSAVDADGTARKCFYYRLKNGKPK